MLSGVSFDKAYGPGKNTDSVGEKKALKVKTRLVRKTIAYEERLMVRESINKKRKKSALFFKRFPGYFRQMRQKPIFL